MNAATGVALSQRALPGTQEPRAALPAPRTGLLWPGRFRLASGERSGYTDQGGEGLNLSGDLPLAWKCLWVLRSGYGCKTAHAFLTGQGATAGRLTLTSRPWSKRGSEKGPD